MEEFVASMEGQSAWHSWRTKGGQGGKGIRKRDAASPYGKGMGSKDEVDKAMS